MSLQNLIYAVVAGLIVGIIAYWLLPLLGIAAVPWAQLLGLIAFAIVLFSGTGTFFTRR